MFYLDHSTHYRNLEHVCSSCTVTLVSSFQIRSLMLAVGGGRHGKPSSADFQSQPRDLPDPAPDSCIILGPGQQSDIMKSIWGIENG